MSKTAEKQDNGFRERSGVTAPTAEEMVERLKNPNYGVDDPAGTEPAGVVTKQTEPDGAVPHRTKLKKPKTVAVKRPRKPPEAPPVVVAPWAEANPKIPVGFNLRMNEVLHAKALFLLTKVPGMSQQKLYLMAVEEKIEALLKDHWGKENG